MRIEFVEIQNFRKLKSIRIDFARQTTLFVGANNSGKTSAMAALNYFLIKTERGRFTINDFTLSNWKRMNQIGIAWESSKSDPAKPIPTLDDWEAVLPSLDLWLNVDATEIHYVSHLLPTLDWEGGLLGISPERSTISTKNTS